MGGDNYDGIFNFVTSPWEVGSGFCGCSLSVSYALQSSLAEERKQKLVPGGSVLHTRCLGKAILGRALIMRSIRLRFWGDEGSEQKIRLRLLK